MKKRKFNKKLVFNKSIISNLNHNEMIKVVGAQGCTELSEPMTIRPETYTCMTYYYM